MCYIEKGRIPHPSAINSEHVQGCVGPSFSVYTIPVLSHLCRKCTVLPSPYLQLCHCFLVGVGLGWVGREVYWEEGGGSRQKEKLLQWGPWIQFLLVFDCVLFCFFLKKKKKDSIGQLPFSTSLFVTRTIVEKMFFSIL